MSQFKKARIDKASSSTPITATSERFQQCGSNWLTSCLFELYKPEPPQINSIDIIFFHGIQFEHNSDAYLSTWRSGDASQEVWPQTWLPAKYPEARIISVSYDAAIHTSGTEGRMDMHIIGENLLNEILKIRRKQGKECPVILVGHSFGGLVIKQLCVHAYRNKGTSGNGQDICKFLDSIRGSFFYATPHRGFNNAVRWEDLVVSSMPANKHLLSFVKTLGKDAARLHEEFEQRSRDYKWRLCGVGELHPMKGQSNLLVDEASARFGDEYITVASDHFSICRPASETCTSYLHLVDFINVIYGQKSKLQDETGNHEDIFRNVMGLEPLVAEILQLLKEHTFLGFCGMGGVGKTTIAKVTFKTLSARFEYTCFMSEVKLIQGSKEQIKKKILENMHHHDSRSVPTTADDVRGRKLLIVLDDIDTFEHAKLLEEMADDNGSEESRFITTSRDAEVLGQVEGNCIYRVPKLEHQVARKLFIARAFSGQRELLGGLEFYVEKVVKACDGLPLTLEVLGKYLREETSVKIWDEILYALINAEADPSSLEFVWTKLKLSYNALGDPEKHMFLDIASFLLLESCPFSLEEAKTAWSSMFAKVHLRWRKLVDRSLIQEESTTYLSSTNERLVIHSFGSNSRMEYGDEVKIVRLHEHLRSMGQRIAKETGRYFSMMDRNCGGNIIHPGKIVAVRTNFSLHSDGDVDCSCDNSCSPRKVQKFFSQLKGVRYLDLDNRQSLPSERCRTSGGFSLPRGLVMFRWRGSNVNVQLPLEALVCRSLAVLRLDRDDDCSLDILSSDACGYLSSLERLTISKSSIIRLPHTFGSLSRLKHMEIIRCPQLTRLPETFGNLSCLTDLKIDKCYVLEGLPETFGNLSSLERLELQWCSGLERLPESFGNLERSLKHLQIFWCEKLEGLPETFGNLSSLERLELQCCSGLERLPESFGNVGRSLKQLQIIWCEKLEGLPETFGNFISLEYLKIKCCDRLGRLPESFGNLGRSLKHLQIIRCLKLEGLPETFGNLSSLERLELEWCSGLERLPESFGNLGRRLKHLQIIRCEKLDGLPETFGNLSSLERLDLQCCSGLKRLPESFGNLGRSLKHLQINWCEKLEGLPETFGNLSSLERLGIEECRRLKWLPESFGNLGRSLKHLRIVECAKLEGLPETFGNLSSLERLGLQWCSELGRLPESFGNLGRRLKHLQISGCEKLEGLPETFGNLSSLERLELQCCSGLEWMPESFGNLGRSLKHLQIYRCEKLEGLPETFGNLSSLERLELQCCSGLERLPESFGNLGRSLKHLQISSCGKLEGLPETFGNLSSLERLELLWCSGLERLPESFGNLGRSLKHLQMSRCGKLEGLPETFGNLSSLERLELLWCSGLERLPESFGNLGRSLKHLIIADCEKLEELSETIRNWSSLKRL